MDVGGVEDREADVNAFQVGRRALPEAAAREDEKDGQR